MIRALVSLGSNEGDRVAHLDNAIRQLRALPHSHFLRESSRRATAPIGGPGGQGVFLNSAAVIETELSAAELLAALQTIESASGRVRATRWGPRTLDLDLLLYGEEEFDSPTLVVPHPRLVCRRFVLEPAAEIAPEMTHPVNGWSLARLLENLENGPHAISLCGPLAERLQRACSAAPTPLVLGPRLDVDLLFIAGRDPFAETFRRRADAPPSLSLPNADFETCRTELLAAIAAME